MAVLTKEKKCWLEADYKLHAMYGNKMKINETLWLIGLFKYLDDFPSTLFQDMRVAMSVDSAHLNTKN